MCDKHHPVYVNMCTYGSVTADSLYTCLQKVDLFVSVHVLIDIAFFFFVENSLVALLEADDL